MIAARQMGETEAKQLEPASDDGLAALIEPRSVALVGASTDPGRIAGRPLRFLIESGYRGRLYPVNPNASIVQGLPSVATLAALDEVPDLAIVSLSAGHTLQAIEECARIGVRGAILLSSGYAEVDAAGTRRQQAIVEVARAAGMRLLGPNCLGLFNVDLGLYATFANMLEGGKPKLGGVAIVSQSGAYGNTLAYMARARGMGVSHWVTTGNEADSTVSDWLVWMLRQERVHAVMAYAEGIRDGAKFLEAARLARALRKPIVMLKVGRSQAGREAASSHTGTLAGSDDVFEGACRQFGIYRARNTEELLDVTYLCSARKFPRGRTLGLVTVSGGVGVQMCDAAELHGLDVAPVPEATRAKLKEILPFAGVGNPVDVTAEIANDPNLLEKNMAILLRECGYNTILVSLGTIAGSPRIATPMREALVRSCKDHPDRLVVLQFRVPADLAQSYQESGFSTFEDVDRAICAIAALASIQEGFEVGEMSTHAPLARQAIPAGPLNEFEARAVLAKAGVPVLDERLVHDEDQAVQAARDLGLPVVLKIVSAQITHKSEMGGVLLDLVDENAVRQGYRALQAAAAQHDSTLALEGVLVMPMAPPGVETIIGVHADATFGPVVMFGLGGTLVELFRDVAFRVAPFDAAEALRMIREVRTYELLRGFRGGPVCDVEALAITLHRVSLFAAAHFDTVKSIDINPFLALPQGGVALDAVLVTREPVLQV